MVNTYMTPSTDVGVGAVNGFQFLVKMYSYMATVEFTKTPCYDGYHIIETPLNVTFTGTNYFSEVINYLNALPNLNVPYYFRSTPDEILAAHGIPYSDFERQINLSISEFGNPLVLYEDFNCLFFPSSHIYYSEYNGIRYPSLGIIGYAILAETSLPKEGITRFAEI